VQFLEDHGVGRLELRLLHGPEGSVHPANPGKRRPRALAMVEERVVEIEENGANHSSIIERANDKLELVPAVVIAASNMISPLRDQLAGEGELITFSDSEPIQALQAILERRPELIVLERLFAATPRGAALIKRIKNDPELAHAEIRVMSHTGDYTRQITRAGAAVPPAATEMKAPAAPPSVDVMPAAAAEVIRAVDWHGTRRAPRVRVKKGVEIQLDGNAVTLVDVSSVGAQVLSATVLRPNQKVRVTIPRGTSSVRYRGAIAWAKFELPKPTAPPVYRAGVEFLDADPAIVTDFAKLHKE
jgi:hypothetical protein